MAQPTTRRAWLAGTIVGAIGAVASDALAATSVATPQQDQSTDLSAKPNPAEDMSRGRLPLQVRAGDALGNKVQRCTVDGLLLMDVIYADEINNYVDHVRVDPAGFVISDGDGLPCRTVPSVPNTRLIETPRGGFPVYRTTGYVLLTFPPSP